MAIWPLYHIRRCFIKIFYLKNKNGFPVTCVASKIVKPLAGQPMVYFDFATHNPADRYNRAKARGTAIGRLEKHGRYGVYLRSERGETRRAIVEEIARLADSQAARDAAYLWLQGGSAKNPVKALVKQLDEGMTLARNAATAQGEVIVINSEAYEALYQAAYSAKKLLEVK